MLTATEMNQCHWALLLDEVLVHIFQHSSHEDLPKAAIVCRAWNEPALRIIWERMDLVDFLKVFRGVTWRDECLHFDKGCTEKNLDRLILYGSWIKTLCLYDWPHNTIVDELRSIIAQLPQPLLPLLHELQIPLLDPIPEETDGSYALVFAGPMLRKLFYGPHCKTATAFCMQIPTLSPFLEELDLLICDVVESSTLTVISEMLARPPALRLVEIEGTDSDHDFDAILSILAGHKHLEELRLEGIGLVPSHPASYRRGFGSLHRLTLISCPGTTSFFERLSSLSELTHIRVADSYMSSCAIVEFSQVVGTFEPLESLILQGYGVGLEGLPVEAL
ncbi:hypothetical protein FRB93_012672 [Tulasnella sp. JGI-2019a]|nr:hypothetical protein FRB93_012672 [Tulasnella sp. JGI-2019a]